jgi:hypothetical protein
MHARREREFRRSGSECEIAQSTRPQEELRRLRAFECHLGQAVAPLPGEHVDLIGPDFGHVPALAVFLIRTIEDHAFDVNPLAFRQVLAADFTELSPRDDTVVVGDFLLGSLRRSIAVGGEREGDPRSAGRCGGLFRVGREVADEDDLVHATHGI